MTLERLERDIQTLDGKLDALRQQITELNVEFSMQKIRIGFLGAAAGSIPMLVVALIWWLTKGAN